MQMISKSRGVRGCDVRQGTGSRSRIRLSVSSTVTPKNGGRPVNSSYRIAPSE